MENIYSGLIEDYERIYDDRDPYEGIPMAKDVEEAEKWKDRIIGECIKQKESITAGQGAQATCPCFLFEVFIYVFSKVYLCISIR